jgi:hypothetical protein
MAQAQQSRTSTNTEPDLIAYDSASILPAGYSYGPPSSIIPPLSGSRSSLDTSGATNATNASSSNNVNGVSMHPSSPDFSNRSRARATSIASKFSGSTLPLYSARDTTSINASASSSKVQHHERKNSGSSHEGNDEDDDSFDGDSDEDDDLEMDTLNKNSGGKGGWKMIAISDTPTVGSFSPSTSTSFPHASTSGRQSFGGEREKAHPVASGKKAHSRFERFDKIEWIAMTLSVVFVALLTVGSLLICFSD